MQDNFDAVPEATWASAAQRAGAPASVAPELSAVPNSSAVPESSAVPALSDDTIFRATQRIPRVTDAPAPADAAEPEEAPQRVTPEEPGPHRSTMVLALVVAVAALATVIGWPLLERRPSVPAVAPPLTTATLSVIAPSPTPQPTQSTTTAIIRPTPPAPVPLPTQTVTAVVTVTATETATASPDATAPSAAPSEAATASPSATPTAGAATLPVSTWRFTVTGLGPITLGTPAAAAVASGYLVADATAPTGYATAPALGAGIRLTVSGGVISAITITDAGVRSAEGIGAGSPITALSTAYGTSLVTLTGKDAAGKPASAPGLRGPASYVAFLPATNGVVSSVVVGNTQPGGSIVLP